MPRGTVIKCDWHMCGCKVEYGDATFMWQDDRRKIFWYEIPRCASTSVRKALKNGLTQYRQDGCTPDLGQKYAREKGYSQFAIIRDPISRLRSCYSIFQLNWERQRGVFGIGKNGHMSFHEFVSSIRRCSDHHFQPQTVFLPQDTSDVTLMNMSDKDFILRWDAFFSSLGNGSADPVLGHAGSSNQANTSIDQILNDEKLSKIVFDFYKDDFKLLGFSKDYIR